MIERFDVVHPDGRREPSQRVVICPRGTPSRPCSHAEIVPLFESRPATAHGLNLAASPSYLSGSPRGAEGSRSRPGSRDKPKKLALEFKLWNPFKSKKSKKNLYLVRETARPRSDLPAVIHHYPQASTPPPPPTMPRERSPVIMSIAPQGRARSRSPQHHKRQPRSKRRPVQRAIVVQHTSSSSEDDTPSPPMPARDHLRKSRSISPGSWYEVEKRLLKKKEQREYAERVAKEEEQARKRAAKVAERERLERLEREKRKQERIDYEERKRLESVENARRRRQLEDFQREQAKRRQELEDIEALNARARADRRREEQDRRRREDHERHRLEEEERLARARRAHIPRQPRHQPAVHYGRESMEDRGERFIREAILEENLRQFERETRSNAGRPYRPQDEGLGRRNTFDGGRRWGSGGRRGRRDRRSD